ncbi:hypothetical protein ACKWTF_015838 [Chironomus riparius]
MQVAPFFAIFSAIFLINSSISTDPILKSTTSHQKLPISICKITNDVISSKVYTQDILIGNFGSKVWLTTVNDIVECIDDRAAVVVTDFKTEIKEKSLRKASIIIMTFSKPSKVIII